MLNKNFSIHFLLIFILTWGNLETFAQLKLKKDSSNLVPFESSKYFNSNIDKQFSNVQSIENNHYISPFQGTLNESLLLGTVGSQLMPIAYRNDFYQGVFSGISALEDYKFNAKAIPYFIANKPLSELDFTFFGYGTECFKGLLSQNLSKKTTIGVGIKKQNNKGFYQNNPVAQNNIYFNIVNQSKRLRTKLEFYYNDATIKENGGYQQDIINLFSPSNWSFQEINLGNAINKQKDYKISLRNRLLIANAPEIKDSIAKLKSLLKPIYSSFFVENELSYSKNILSYRDEKAQKTYYGASYMPIDTLTFLETYFRNNKTSNQFSLNYNLYKGEKEYINIKSYLQTEWNHLDRGANENNVIQEDFLTTALGGSANFNFPLGISLNNSIYKPFTGYTKNDFFIESELSKNVLDARISFKGSFASQRPGYFYNYMYTNNLVATYDFQNQKTLNFSGTISSEKWKGRVEVQYLNISNFLFYDENALPVQEQNSIFQLKMEKELSYKSLYTNHLLIYQNSYYQKLWYKATFALKNSAFKKNLNYFIGTNITFNTNYNVFEYNPLLMQSINLKNPTKNDFFPIVDLFATLKISNALLSFTYENLLTSLTNKGFYHATYYPISPSAFYLRLNWRFLE